MIILIVEEELQEEIKENIETETDLQTGTETEIKSELEEIKEELSAVEQKETAQTNCLALTVRKNYNLSIIKNSFTTGLRVSWKIAVSTFFLNLLKFLF